MINYLSSVFHEPAEEEAEDYSNLDEERSVELIELFQRLFGLLNKLNERERNASAPLAARHELLLGTEGSEFSLLFSRIVDILEEESEWWAAQSMRCDENGGVIDVPCADAFIMCQGLRKLCLFAVEDSPRGCLPLILSSIASLLRAVRYPLLPHKSIHEPISRLIFVGARYDKFLGSVLALTTGLTSLEQSEYQRKVDVGLASLINAIWNKVVENPVILEFFCRESYYSDEEDDEEEGEDSSIDKSLEFDIISAIIPIMGSHHIGSMCKESLICALSLRNPRVDHYVASHTTVIRDCVSQLERKFYAALTALTESCRLADSRMKRNDDWSALVDGSHEEGAESFFLPMLLSPLKTAHSAEVNKDKESRENGAQATGKDNYDDIDDNENDMLSQATSAFSNYLFSTPQKGSSEKGAAQSPSSDGSLHSDQAGVVHALMRVFHFCDAVLVSAGDAAIGAGASLRSHFVEALRGSFLESVFLPALRGRLTRISADEGDDYVASAACLIFRRVLRDLSSANSAEAGILSVLLPFLSRSLSSARTTPDSMTLLDELLSRTVSPSSVVATSSSGVIAAIVDSLPLGESCSLLLAPLVSPARVPTEESEGLRGEDEDEEGEEDHQEEEEDGEALLNIQPLMHPLLLQLKAANPAERLRLMLPHLEQEGDGEGLAEDTGVGSTFQACVSAQVSKLTARVAFNNSDSIYCSTVATHDDDLRGTLVDFLLSRVQNFRAHKFEEKIALSSLVERAVCVCLSVEVLSGSHAPNPRGTESTALLGAVKLYMAIDAICSQVTRAAQRCGAVSEDNLQAARLILRCGHDSDGGLTLPRDISEGSRALLETAVLASEMRREVSAFFFAAAQLSDKGAFVPRAILGTSAVAHKGLEDSSDEEDDPILPMDLSVVSDIEPSSALGVGQASGILQNSTTIHQLSPMLLRNRARRGSDTSPRRGDVEDAFLSELSELEDGLNSLVTAI